MRKMILAAVFFNLVIYYRADILRGTIKANEAEYAKGTAACKNIHKKRFFSIFINGNEWVLWESTATNPGYVWEPWPVPSREEIKRVMGDIRK